ncbi:MAG: hypothetical protein JO259_13525, partial [Mycobacterium sp.]|nr:hypothetical protein [Mycobacterium sp.]
MNSARIHRMMNVIGSVIVIGAITAACQGKGSNNNPPSAGTSAGPTSSAGAAAKPAPTSGHTAPSSAAPVGSAVVLPFTGLDRPTGVSVDSDGAIYVTDTGHNRVVKLPANSETQTVLAATDINKPQSLTAVSRDEVSVTDATTNRVLWSQAPTTSPSAPWKATSSTEWVGPFSGLKTPRGVVTLNGVFYVVDSGNNRVVKWAPGSN